jgi:3-oxoacyl-[acyl-carrier-protein] synthase II
VTRLVVTGAGVVSAAGLGLAAMTRYLAAPADPPPQVTALYPDRLPYAAAPVLVDFDVRALLGRKGTSFLDRATALAVVACGQAIEDGGLILDKPARARTGVVLGTTVGSLRSSSEFSRETLLADRPYLVNPVLFPNTVMNCAAGQTAIRYGLEGVNSTVAAGRLGFLSALRYAASLLRRGYADIMLAGAVEEFTPHRAWWHHQIGSAGLPGEAAAVFLLEREDTATGAGRTALAQVLAMVGGYHPGGDPAGLRDRLAGCMRAVLAEAGLDAGQVGMVAVTEPGRPQDQRIGSEAAAAVLGTGRASQVSVQERLGDCGAAVGALQFALMLAHRDEPGGAAGTAGLLAGCTPEGAFAAAVIRSCCGAGARRG